MEHTIATPMVVPAAVAVLRTALTTIKIGARWYVLSVSSDGKVSAWLDGEKVWDAEGFPWEP